MLQIACKMTGWSPKMLQIACKLTGWGPKMLQIACKIRGWGLKMLQIVCKLTGWGLKMLQIACKLTGWGPKLLQIACGKRWRMVKEKERSRRGHRSHRSHTSQEPKATKPGSKKEKKSTPQKKYGKKMLSLCNYAPVLEASMQFWWGSMPWSENCQAAHLIECVLCEGTARWMMNDNVCFETCSILRWTTSYWGAYSC